MKQAIEVAIDEKNAAGGIAGARIEPVAGDDATNDERGRDAARAFCADPSVLGVVGHYNSNVSLAAVPVYESAGLVNVTPIVSNPALTEQGYQTVFRFTNRDDRTAAAIAGHLARVLGKRRAVVAATPTTYGGSMADTFARAFQAQGGEILQRVPAEEGRRDFADLVRTLPRDFDLLFYGGSFEGAAILKALRQAGLDQLFAAGDGCWDRWNFLEAVGEVASAGEGVLVLSATPELGRVPGSEEFAERYARQYGPIGNYAVNSYDSARVLLAAIETAALNHGVPARAQVLSAMRGVRCDGIAYRQPVQWDRKGDNAAAVTALHVIEHGRYKQVAETASTAAEERAVTV
jgi:branched-chain amino acid transport system substrate-binding protein